MTFARLMCLLIMWSSFIPSAATSHALEPGYLEITPVAGESYRVVWRIPDVKGQPMQISVRLSDACTPRQAPPVKWDGRAWARVWVVNCAGGVSGTRVEIVGLDQQRTDVLVRYQLAEGGIKTQRLTPTMTAFVVPENPNAFDVLQSYFPLGVEHILAGVDHLLFVFALLLLISDRWRLLGAITAFTVAHSLTMAVATLGWVTLPGPPVEAVIALSIMFLASELALRDQSHQRLSERYPWTVSFTFGLLHGFGFAGALREIGLPEGDVPLALLSFNLGVEAGQLLFVTAVLISGWLFRRLLPSIAAVFHEGTRAAFLGIYAIGGVSAYWFIERLAGF